MDVITVIRPYTAGEKILPPALPEGVITPEEIPPAPKEQPVPVIRLLLPVVMVLLIIGMVIVMVKSGANPMMAIFPLMMAVSMFTMVSGAKKEDLNEQRRAFMRHIEVIRNKARTHAQAQKEYELHFYPEPHRLWTMVGNKRMWEREKDQYSIRIGSGKTQLCTPIDIPDSGATEDLDPVCALRMREFDAEYSTVSGIPIVVELASFKKILITGSHAHDLMRAILAQLLFHYGPEAVEILWTHAHYDWLKWAPHAHKEKRRTPGKAQFSIYIGEEFSSEADCSFAIHPKEEDHNQADLFIIAEENIVLDTSTGAENLGYTDMLNHNQAEYLARALTAFQRPGIKEEKSHLLTHIDWKSSQANRLKVPIGRDNHGASLYLDIKEHSQGGVGPHGLCIGATGSGKSELLRTLVVALAARHSPQELNFVLVDFKGGATFLGLEALPHTSAVITNLSDEASMVNRMHDALSGEMNRRQELLRRAGNFSNVGQYNKACPEKPLPALLIIVDEFSELLGQHPDFADLFVMVGRLGRSLHIHLLLASQRLEEGKLRGLDSHLSYRIGLKTFSAGESRQVLGIPDAYQLPAQPGAGYIRMDAEKIIRFDADYVSGPIYDEETQEHVAPMVSFDGWHSLATEQISAPNQGSQASILDRVVQACVHQAALENYSAHRIWLDPLPAYIDLVDVLRTHADDVLLRIPIGLIDRPYAQRQDPFVLDFSGAMGHTAICGGPQTGKSTALCTIMLALVATHSTEDIRFYCIGSVFADYMSFPHIAAHASFHETERIRFIIDEVLGLIDKPEARHTFLIIDGWHSLGEEYHEELSRIAADGLASRVHLLVSTPRWANIRTTARDLIGCRIEFRLGEAMDTLIDRHAQKAIPSRPGCGINMDGEQIMFASVRPHMLPGLVQYIDARGEEHVPVLKELPEYISRQDFLRNYPHEGLSFGLLAKGLVPAVWNYMENPFLFIAGNRSCGKSIALLSLMQSIEALDNTHIMLVDHKRSNLGCPMKNMEYSATIDSTRSMLEQLAGILASRLPHADITAQELRERSWWSGPHIFLLIDDLDILPEGLLFPLKEYIPYARDIGFSLVLARRAGGMSRSLFSPVISDIREQNPLLLYMDSDREEGPIFGVKPMQCPPGRGQWGNSGMMLVAHPDGKEEE